MNKHAPRSVILEPMVRHTAVAQALDIHPSTLWRWIKCGRFPRPIKYGLRTSGWKQSQVEEWISGHENEQKD
jgi:prophage regulatory protein